MAPSLLDLPCELMDIHVCRSLDVESLGMLFQTHLLTSTSAALAVVHLAGKQGLASHKDDPKSTALLRRLSERLHLLEELRSDESVLEDAGEDLSGRSFMLAAIKNNPHALRYATEPLRDDPEVVKVALEQNGMALMHASERLRDDVSTVKLAVMQDGNALGVASRSMRSNKEVVMIAVEQGGPKETLGGISAAGGPFHYACGSLKEDVDVVSAALKEVKRRHWAASAENENGPELSSRDEASTATDVTALRAELQRYWYLEIATSGNA